MGLTRYNSDLRVDRLGKNLILYLGLSKI